MPKKKNIKSANNNLASDIAVTLLCLAGFYLSLHFFYQAINQSLGKINETPIGTITFHYGTAQRKLSDRVLWDRVRQESPIYNGDIIRTAELSEATITFIDGNMMNLYDQTLAQVFLDIDGGASVDFSGGGISLDASSGTKGITLTSGNATVQLEGGSVLNAVASVSDGTSASAVPFSLQVVAGSASVTATEGNVSAGSISLTEGNALILDENSQSFLPPSLTVLSPTVNAKYLKHSGSSLPIQFSWATANITQGDFITLETSRTADFSQIAEQISFTNVNNVTLDMSEGTWYWRIYNEADNYGTNGKLQVLDAPPATAVVPANNAEYTYRTKNPSIRFVWTADEYVSSYLFEVANNPQMSNPVISQRSTQSSSIISSLAQGTWYWQVTSIYDAGAMIQNPNETNVSAVNSFSVVQQGDLLPSQLVLPAESGFLNITQATAGFHFSWTHDAEADYYTVIIDDTTGLTSPIVMQQVSDNYFVLTPEIASLPEGRYYWAVTKTDSEGNTSQRSNERSFFVVSEDLEQRTIFPSDNYTLSDSLTADMRFTWKTNIPLETRFQIASDAQFRNLIIDRVVTNTSISGLNLPTGTLYWRIYAANPEDNLEFATEPKILKVVPPLDKVTVTTPAPEAILVATYNTLVEYRWEPTPNAQYYQFKLFHESDMNRPVYEDLTLVGTSTRVNMQSMPEGNYIWTMQAMASETPLSTRQSGILTTSSFILRKPIPVTLVSPANNTEVEGLVALLNPISVTWSTSENPRYSEFILTNENIGMSVASRNTGARPNSDSIYFRVANPGSVIQLPVLTDGTWYWTVLSTSHDNHDITALEPSSIIVTPIPPLPAANNLTPPTTTVFDVNYFMNNRFLDFSWDSVEGASDYIFIVKNNADDIIFEEIIPEISQYRIADLSVLDKGTFTWTVEAILRLENGTVVQRGNIATSEFTIDIPQLSAPTQQSTGELYGL